MQIIDSGLSYHSKHGALQETQIVFLDAGLHYKALGNTCINILEIGFGTGLNAFMTYLEAKKNAYQIDYLGIEAYPPPQKLIEKLNFAAVLGVAEEQDTFMEMHSKENIPLQISESFRLEKRISLFETLTFQDQFDLIYYDAFSPSAQPSLWEDPLIQKMHAALRVNGRTS